jgi:hypothetical protein
MQFPTFQSHFSISAAVGIVCCRLICDIGGRLCACALMDFWQTWEWRSGSKNNTTHSAQSSHAFCTNLIFFAFLWLLISLITSNIVVTTDLHRRHTHCTVSCRFRRCSYRFHSSVSQISTSNSSSQYFLFCFCVVVFRLRCVT